MTIKIYDTTIFTIGDGFTKANISYELVIEDASYASIHSLLVSSHLPRTSIISSNTESQWMKLKIEGPLSMGRIESTIKEDREGLMQAIYTFIGKSTEEVKLSMEFKKIPNKMDRLLMRLEKFEKDISYDSQVTFVYYEDRCSLARLGELYINREDEEFSKIFNPKKDVLLQDEINAITNKSKIKDGKLKEVTGLFKAAEMRKMLSEDN